LPSQAYLSPLSTQVKRTAIARTLVVSNSIANALLVVNTVEIVIVMDAITILRMNQLVRRQ
jgi:hypothetical protein